MRVTKQRRLELLGNVWLFEQCSRRELNVLEGATTEMELPAGKILTKQGEIGRPLHGDRGGRGRGDPRRHPDRRARPRRRSSGRCRCSTASRAATAVTLVPTHVLMLTTDAFNDVLTTMPSVDRKLLAVVAGRLREIEAKYVPGEPARRVAERSTRATAVERGGPLARGRRR